MAVLCQAGVAVALFLEAVVFADAVLWSVAVRLWFYRPQFVGCVFTGCGFEGTVVSRLVVMRLWFWPGVWEAVVLSWMCFGGLWF